MTLSIDLGKWALDQDKVYLNLFDQLDQYM